MKSKRQESICALAAAMFVVVVFLGSGQCADDLQLETDSVEQDYAAELPRIPPTEPQDALAKFRIADGFRIELAANEPLISDPISMAFDELGRLFVICMHGYSEHGPDNLGVVRLLEDSDDDGVFDTGTNFATGLSWPTAIACFRGGVFVGAAPDLWYLKDVDGDGKADQKELVATGFSRKNVQGLLNSFRWALDNRLYASAGLNGGNLKDPAGNDIIKLRGRDFVMEPHTRTIQAISGGAQHGATFGRWGDRFVCSNSDHLQWIEFEDRHLNRNPLLTGYRARRSIAVDGPSADVYRTSNVEPWRIVRTRLRVKSIVGGPVEGGGRASGYFTSASGVTVYQGDAFGPEYRESEYVFVGDVGSNLVHMKKIAREPLERSGHRISPDQSEFLTSTDNWFRPVQFANGPDGSLYVIDMYREVIEHPLSLPPMIKKHLDLNSGRKRGRIYRVVPSEWLRSRRQLPGSATASELVGMLGHANGWHRETAGRLIVEKAVQSDQQRTLFAAHLLRVCDDDSTPLARIRAAYCLHSIGRMNESTLVGRLNDSHAQVRQHALIIAESSAIRGNALAAQLESMVDDEALEVRYQLALTLGAFDWPLRGDILLSIAKRDGGNRKMRFAILSSMADHRLPLLRTLTDAGNFPGDKELGDQIAFQIGQDRRRCGEALHFLRNHSFRHRDRLCSKLLIGTRHQGESLLQFLAAAEVKEPENFVQRLALAAQQQVLNQRLPVAERLFALEVACLGEFHDVRSLLQEILSPSQVPDIRDAVVSAAGRFASPAAYNFLIDSTPYLSATARRTAINSLISRPESAALLMEALRTEALSFQLISAPQRQNLMRHRSKEVARVAQTVFGTNANRKNVVQKFRTVLASRGDPQRGKQLFRKACATCHQLDDIGVNVGPNLVPLRNRGAEFMLTNILDPNREVDPRYEAYSFVTNDGRTFSGIVVEDTGDSNTVLQPDGKSVVIDKGDIESATATGQSLMPEGLERDLNEQGLADLIAYLIQTEKSQMTETKP